MRKCERSSLCARSRTCPPKAANENVIAWLLRGDANGTGGLLRSHPSPYEAPVEPHERHSIADMVRQR